MKFQNRYPLSGMLICPYCGKTLRRRQVYKKKIQWLCSTYIEKGVKACKGIRIDDAELQGLNITEQTVIEEVVIRSVSALMTFCTGGQKKQEPKPNRMEKTTMQVKDQRLPE